MEHDVLARKSSDHDDCPPPRASFLPGRGKTSMGEGRLLAFYAVFPKFVARCCRALSCCHFVISHLLLLPFAFVLLPFLHPVIIWARKVEV